MRQGSSLRSATHRRWERLLTAVGASSGAGDLSGGDRDSGDLESAARQLFLHILLGCIDMLFNLSFVFAHKLAPEKACSTTRSGTHAETRSTSDCCTNGDGETESEDCWDDPHSSSNSTASNKTS